MTGQDLINYIEEGKLQDKHFFINDVHNRERYFEEWFSIIPEHDAKILWDDGDRSFLVLRKDGSDAYADCYDSWEEIPEDALFGLDKKELE